MPASYHPPVVSCPRCRSTRLRVYRTVRREDGWIERHRLCLVCDREWVNQFREPVEEFLRNKPSLRRPRDKVAV